MISRARFVGFGTLILLLFFPSPSIQAADTFIPPPRRIDDVLEALRASQVSDPEQIAEWRKQQAMERTKANRPDLLDDKNE